jgi:ubiquinone/menaquinone biosynthesis C-methylase UbiE
MTSTTATQSVYGRSYGGTAPENYQRYFVPVIGGPFATELVAAAALRRGERVLDVACGTGVVARLAAERVGPGGSVAGVDVNPGMLSVARSLPVGSGAAIRWYETGAESIPLPDAAFDVAFCQLGLQFMADRPAALREIRRTLVPGGRVLVSTPPPNPFFGVMDEALARHVGEDAAGFVRMVFSLNDPSAIRQLFEDALYRDVEVRTIEKVLRLPEAKDFFWQYVHCTPLTGIVSRLDASQIAALERDIALGWQPWSRDGGITYAQGMIVTTAQR